MKSLHRHLQCWLMSALGLGALCLMLATYVHERDEIDALFDETLRQVALSAASQFDPSGASLPVPAPVPLIEADRQLSFVTQAFDRTGRRVLSSHPSPLLPYTDVAGPRELSVAGEQWFSYGVVTGRGTVIAAQRADLRRAAAREVVLKLVGMLAVLLAFMAILLYVAVRRGLRPLDEMTAQIARRSAHSLAPLSAAEFPREIHPLIGAINDLMARLGAALEAQQGFVADAAHELRTPITALRLQLQLLREAADAQRRAEADRELGLGIERVQRLVTQLLDLSRVEPQADASGAVDLRRIAVQEVAALSVMADDRRIDLGLLPGDPMPMQGNEAELRTLVANLVDNAIRYTPGPGRVDVSIHGDDRQVVLEVLDTGPGIPAAERERVFDRFFRLPAAGADGSAEIGSGIGLAVVKKVVQRHRGRVALEDGPRGQGLRVVVTLPRSAPSGGRAAVSLD